MSLLSKFRAVQPREPVSRPVGGMRAMGASPLHATAGASAPRSSSQSGRFSNGLKEFLWQLDDIGRGTLLDLGAVSQATLNFFIELGFKVYTEDLLAGWSKFLREEETQRAAQLPAGASAVDMSAGAQADRFLSTNLQHARDSFDAVLLWDVLDYMDRKVASRFVSRISGQMRDAGALLAIFHTRLPEQFHRYRVVDGHNLELVTADALVQPLHVFQNREIQEVFGRFRSSKTFVGRDQLREGVFVK